MRPGEVALVSLPPHAFRDHVVTGYLVGELLAASQRERFAGMPADPVPDIIEASGCVQGTG
jgi:hypothetical protein